MAPPSAMPLAGVMNSLAIPRTGAHTAALRSCGKMNLMTMSNQTLNHQMTDSDLLSCHADKNLLASCPGYHKLLTDTKRESLPADAF